MQPIEYTGHEYGAEIPVGDIKVDLAVQRAIVPSRLRKLSRFFDPILLGELLVSRREDGNLYILDGQHRLRAASNGAGVAAVNCEVFTGLSRADEARLFMGRNDRAGIASLDRDRNLATSGDQDTLNVQMAAQGAGFVFIANKAEDSTYRDRAAGIQIMRDAERRKHVESSGTAHLGRVFQLYARIWGNQDAPESSVLKALSKILLTKGADVDEDRLYERLRGLPPQQLDQSARDLREQVSQARGISLVRACIERIADQYNRGLPTDSAKRIRV